MWFDGLQMEALDVNLEGRDIVIKALNSKSQKILANNTIGEVGKSTSIKAVTLEMNDSDIILLYRVHLKNIGWTKFANSGEICGVLEISEGTKAIVIDGIQIICENKNDNIVRENIINKAEQKLREYSSLVEKLFVIDKNKMLEASSSDFTRTEALEVKEIENGRILPLKKIAKSRNGIFIGGVCDENNCFIAGHVRKVGSVMNMSCVEGYIPDVVENVDEEVIFGGILIGFFGHALTECTSRLWWILQHPENTNKIVFLNAPETGKINTNIIELAGIPLERVEFIDKPTQFKKVIVPEQSILLWDHVHPKEFLMTYDCINEKIVPSNFKKIYLTRTRFKKKDGINEEFFENFFASRGYDIFELEEHSIEKQISILMGAEDVVCTAGTLSHMALFCKDGISLTIINRTVDHILIPQIIINQCRRFNVKYIDATFNFLPTAHVCGPSLYGPTKYFKEYAKYNGFDYEKDIEAFDINAYMYDYVKKWMKTYSNEKNFNEISNKDMSQFIQGMYIALEEDGLKKYKTKLQMKIEKLTEENKKLKAEIKG